MPSLNSCYGNHRWLICLSFQKFNYILLYFWLFLNLKISFFFWFQEETYKSRRPFSASYRPAFSVNNRKMKLKDVNPDKPPKGTQSQAPSPRCTRHFSLDQPAESNLGNNFKYPAERRPPFVVRHVSLRYFSEYFGMLDHKNKWVILNREFKLNNNCYWTMFTC